MTVRTVPFDGTPPQVADGDQVEIRDSSGVWHRAVAKSEPRYDQPNAIGRRCYLTVAVDHPSLGVVNWPAEDVRPVPAET